MISFEVQDFHTYQAMWLTGSIAVGMFATMAILSRSAYFQAAIVAVIAVYIWKIGNIADHVGQILPPAQMIRHLEKAYPELSNVSFLCDEGQLFMSGQIKGIGKKDSFLIDKKRLEQSSSETCEGDDYVVRSLSIANVMNEILNSELMPSEQRAFVERHIKLTKEKGQLPSFEFKRNQ